MKILRPIKSNWITQDFGDNKPCAKLDDNGRAIRPFKVVNGQNDVPCSKGYSKLYPLLGLFGHNSMDMALWLGEPIHFSVIADTKWYSLDASDADGGLGVDVFSVRRIDIPELPPETGTEARKDWEAHNHTIRVKFRHWHMSEVWKDQEVVLGEIIGKGGSTGVSTGPHLHGVAMKFVDDKGNTFDKWNGYYGCVDYTKIGLWNNVFILDYLKAERKIKLQIKETQLSLIDILRKIILQLQIQILKLKKGIGGFINNK